MNHVTSKQQGQIIIIALVFMMIVLTSVVALVGYAGVQIKAHRQGLASTQALNIAEAGLELAIWKLNNQPGYTGETSTSYANGTYTVTITNLSASSKLLKAEAFVPNATNPIAGKTVQVTAAIGTTNIGFNYGVQVGNGGLEMSNISKIVGNVYSNGNITGTNSARIEGTAIAAEDGIIEGMDVDINAQAYTIRGTSTVGGNATVSVLQNSTVGGNLVADTISSCTVGGNATYDTSTSCTISGSTTTPNPDDYSPAPEIPLPITEEQIDLWEEEAEEGGVIGTQNYSSGSVSLGPKKIDGDLILTNTAEVVVTGTLWVTGQILLRNSAILRLSPLYGSQSGIIIAGIDESPTNGYIEIDNSAQVLGSGTAGSYVLLLSQMEGTASLAIKQINGSGVAILYAGEGAIEISNNSNMKEITAERLIISNSAQITYESGLASSNFSSGPGGGWEIVDQSWQLLQ